MLMALLLVMAAASTATVAPGLVYSPRSTPHVGAREAQPFDFSFRFAIEQLRVDARDEVVAAAANNCSSPAAAFPVNVSGQACSGLQPEYTMANATACAASCCADPSCVVWQFTSALPLPPAPEPHGGCWQGSKPCTTLRGKRLWLGGARSPLPPPPPGPAAPPGSTCTGACEAVGYNDSQWSTVDAPHDMLIRGSIRRSNQGQAYLPRPVGWYRKRFNLPAEWRAGRAVWIRWDGIFRTTVIYLNGQPVGGSHGSGYTSFTTRLDNASGVLFGAGRANENVLAVRVDPKGTGWWYEGGGIYRHCQLISAPLVHLVQDGAAARAMVTGAISTNGKVPADGYSAASVRVTAHAEVVNGGAASVDVAVQFSVLEAGGSRVGEAVTSPYATLSAGATAMLTASPAISLARTELWAIPRPYLYSVTVTVLTKSHGTKVAVMSVPPDMNNSSTAVAGDMVVLPLGVSSNVWTADDGFHLNGKRVQIRGFCDHDNWGGLGMAVPDRLQLFKAQLLRSVGANGRRFSHNAADPVMLRIYDRLGVVAMDENRVMNMAHVGDMAAMVKRDRAHPSVVIWSMCNEVGCSTKSGLASAFRAAALEYDGTRPTLGNKEKFGAHGGTDVEGFSHRNGSAFDDFHRRGNASKPTMASECCSCYSVNAGWPWRTNYHGDGNLRGMGYQGDCIAAQSNASASRRFMAGTMVWTMMDYYGESKGWPRISSQYGSAFDLVGLEKGGAAWYRSWWLDHTAADADDRPAGYGRAPTHSCRIWNDRWDAESGGDPSSTAGGGAASVGANRTVRVATAEPFAELLLDGVSLGIKAVPTLGTASFSASWKPGSNLSAVCRASAQGAPSASHTIIAPAAAVSLRLTVDVPNVATGTGTALLLNGQDAGVVRAEVVDAAGHVVTTATNNVSFSVLAGPGRIIGSHNGDVYCHTPQSAPWHAAYRGSLRAVVQVTEVHSLPMSTRRRMLEVDAESGVGQTRIIVGDTQAPPQTITVQATSPGLATATAAVMLCTDESRCGVLAAAEASWR
jgi:hypothetical protein